METKTSLKKAFQLSIAFILVLCTNISAFAQDVPKKVDININTDSGGTVWYGQPWIWAIGIAIFILILVIITRSNKSDKAS